MKQITQSNEGKLMKIKVCLVQDSPVFFDKERTIQKIEDLSNQYSKEGCELIIFPVIVKN